MIFVRPPLPGRVPPARSRPLFTAACLWTAFIAPVTAAATPVEVRVSDWATMPFSGNLTTTSGIPAYMSRVNFVRPEPGGSGRLWVCDLNGNLHIFDPAGSSASRTAQLLDQAKTRTAYLDFNGQSSTSDSSEKAYVPNAAGTGTSAQAPNGLFPLFTKQQGYANGLVTFAFDPAYATNGKFYTVHIEKISADGAAGRLPVTTKFPGFNAAGYSSTPVINPAGPVTRQAVLIEWTDTNPGNLTFEGSARELLRLAYTSHIHPLGDITFDPTAQPGDPEWGVMYLASGDGGSGESNGNDDSFPYVSNGDRHYNPQRLDTMVGKILRIIPDLALHEDTSSVSPNGRYRIPNDNPFTNAATYPGARKEIWTYGHRNPHRFIWQVPDDNPAGRTLMVAEIGLKAWEEVNILKKGANYGYAEREGPQKLTISTSSSQNQKLSALPSPDNLPIRLNGSVNAPGDVVPIYPVITYPHAAAYGDAIANGFIYRGASIPTLQGKFIFGDITTGKLFFCDWSAMLAADDGDAATTAPIQSLTLAWDDPYDSPDAGVKSFDRFFEIVEKGYNHRGGIDSDLPGTAPFSGDGRADIRLAVDAAGELYVTSKSDGMIRRLTSGAPPEFVSLPVNRVIDFGASTTFTANAQGTPGLSYQWQRLPVGSDAWLDITNDAVFSGAGTAVLTLTAPDYGKSGDRYRCEASCSGADALSTAASLVLRAIPSSWLTTYFNATERADLTISGDMADPDHDGLVNLLEYAFAFDPESDSSAALPKLVMDGPNVTLTFPIPRSTMNYVPQKSTDLVTWDSAGISASSAAGNMTASYPLSASPRTFLRIAVAPK